MPVLMNKGTNPREAAWLFYTDSATLDALGRTAAEQRFDAGVLTVDAADLDAAPKASSEVPVYLAVATLVPEDFDLAKLMEQAAEDGEGATDGNPVSGEDSKAADEGAENSGDADVADATDNADATDGEADAGNEADTGLPYKPVPAPEGLRVRIGTTTAAAARAFIQPREVDGKPWAAELPGLPMLVSLIDYMREHNGIAPWAVWHVDPQGILRMAPAKELKPMAGNVLKCKL